MAKSFLASTRAIHRLFPESNMEMYLVFKDYQTLRVFSGWPFFRSLSFWNISTAWIFLLLCISSPTITFPDFCFFQKHFQNIFAGLDCKDMGHLTSIFNSHTFIAKLGQLRSKLSSLPGHFHNSKSTLWGGRSWGGWGVLVSRPARLLTSKDQMNMALAMC